MKRFLLILALFFVAPTVSRADWAYVSYSPGWYLRTNGVSNDGFIYYKQCTPYYGSCHCYSYGGCYYVQWGPISATGAADYGVQNNYKVETVNYSRNWKTDMVAALSANKDSELFIQALHDSGLRSNLAPSASSYSAYGLYGSSGLTTIAQGYASGGYASQGSTGYGLAAIPANTPVNVNQMINDYQRGANSMTGAALQIHTHLADLLGQAVAGNSDEATIIAGGNVAAAAIMATKAKVSQQQWETHPTTQPPADPTPELPSPPSVPQSRAAPRASLPLTIISGFAKYQANHCADCHDGKGKDAPNFSETVLRTMSADDRHKLATTAIKRMTTDAPGKPRMPKGHPALSESDSNDIAVYFYGN